MMKIKKLGQKGFSHHILLVAIAVIVAIGGIYWVVRSLAATPVMTTPGIATTAYNGNCLDDQNDLLNNQNPIITIACNGITKDGVEWGQNYGEYLVYSGYRIHFHGLTNRCVVPTNRSRSAGAGIVLSSCSGYGVVWLKSGDEMINRLSGLCLTIHGALQRAQLEKCTNAADQQWIPVNIEVNPSRCINPSTGETVDSANSDPYPQLECIGWDLMQAPPYNWNPQARVLLTRSNGQTVADTQWHCLDEVWDGEDGDWVTIDGVQQEIWDRTAYDPILYDGQPNSGAYGIPQAFPGYKYGSEGYPKADSPAWGGISSGIDQIKWGLSYISGVYSTPCGAEQHELTYNNYTVKLPPDSVDTAPFGYNPVSGTDQTGGSSITGNFGSATDTTGD